MKNKEYPKFEKVDDHTIRIIQEVAEEVPLHVIVGNYEKLKKQKQSIIATEKNIETLLESAKKLGITPLDAKNVEPPKSKR